MFEIMPYAHRNAVRFDPFYDFDRIERSLFGKNSMSTFSTDIKDTGDAYRLEADLPGFDRDNIKVELKNGYMTISAERRAENEKKDKNDNVIFSERSFGSFERRFELDGIDENGISAEYNNGVLTVTMPKKAKNEPEVKRLEIK